MKITILTYLESERAKTLDVVVEQVSDVLKASGHDVSVLPIHGHLDKLMDGLTRPRPDLVFNLMEMFGNNVFGDIPAHWQLQKRHKISRTETNQEFLESMHQ